MILILLQNNTLINNIPTPFLSGLNTITVDAANTTTLSPAESTTSPKEVQFSEEEKFVIIQSDSFSAFIDFSSKVIERALNETYDYTVDNRKTSDTQTVSDSDSNLKQLRYFYSERWSKNRSINKR